MADSGPGHPAGRVSRIMEPFFTTKARGLGLGLAISRSIVDKNQGELRAASQPGNGNFVHRPPQDRPVPRSGSLVAMTAHAGVLVVDDVIDSATPLPTSSGDIPGSRVATSRDGPSGPEIVRHMAYDLAPIDLELPGGHLARIFERVRSASRRPGPS